jgi:predicted TIM-barrel fold metal-dependent hydrolase
MIIDGHAHMGGTCNWASYEIHKISTPLGPVEYFGPEVFLKIMDSLKIDKAVVTTTKPWGDPKDNDDIAKIANRFPDRFIAVPWINPLRENALDDFKRYVKDYGMKGLKLHPPANGYYVHMPFVHPFIEFAVKSKVPVMIHSGTPPNSEPWQIAVLADTFPDAKIVMIHMGLSEMYARDAQDVAIKYDNVWLETSGMHIGHVNGAIKRVGAEKVIFGSDTPWSMTEFELLKIKLLHLPKKDEELVLGKNIAELIGDKK